MAGLLFAAGFLTYKKAKDKRDAKKEKKRKGYEERYLDLQREHSQNEERFLQKQKAGNSQPVSNRDLFQKEPAEPRERRSSEDSQRSHHSVDDDPSKWVNEVIMERSKNGGLQGG
jgi:hypothetical protein